MEPSGRNRWQPVANRTRSKIAQTGRSATGGKPRQPFRSDGKEGVEGRRFASVREGLFRTMKPLQKGGFSVAVMDTAEHLLDKEGIDDGEHPADVGKLA